MTIDIVFDNNGGALAKFEADRCTFNHYYDDMEQLAIDYVQAKKTDGGELEYFGEDDPDVWKEIKLKTSEADWVSFEKWHEDTFYENRRIDYIVEDNGEMTRLFKKTVEDIKRQIEQAQKEHSGKKRTSNDMDR